MKNKTCRICLDTSTDLTPLNIKSDFDKRYTLLGWLEECLSVQLTMLDHYPQNICLTCLSSLKSAYDFREICLHSEDVVRAFDADFMSESVKFEDNHNMLLEIKQESDDIDSKTNGLNREIKLAKRKNRFESRKSLGEDNREKSVKYKCKLCEMTFINKKSLGKHAHKVHNTPWKCKRCEFESLNWNEFVEHRSTHIRRTYTCNHCDDTLRSKQKLRAHLRYEHGDESSPSNSDDERMFKPSRKYFKCAICGEQFKSGTLLREHTPEHLNDQGVYLCIECPLTFSLYSDLRKHLLHKNQQEQICPHCGFVAKTISNYHQHIKRKHNAPEVKLECDKCQKAFSFANELRAHELRIHSDKRDLLCPTCGKTFATGRQLNRHLLTHKEKVQSKDFKCESCSNAYRTRELLLKHIKIHGAKKFQCPYCSKTFAMNRYLKKHLYTHTGEKPLACHYCDHRFIQHSHRTYHIQNHHSPGKAAKYKQRQSNFGVDVIVKEENSSRDNDEKKEEKVSQPFSFPVFL